MKKKRPFLLMLEKVDILKQNFDKSAQNWKQNKQKKINPIEFLKKGHKLTSPSSGVSISFQETCCLGCSHPFCSPERRVESCSQSLYRLAAPSCKFPWSKEQHELSALPNYNCNSDAAESYPFLQLGTTWIPQHRKLLVLPHFPYFLP